METKLRGGSWLFGRFANFNLSGISGLFLSRNRTEITEYLVILLLKRVLIYMIQCKQSTVSNLKSTLGIGKECKLPEGMHELISIQPCSTRTSSEYSCELASQSFNKKILCFPIWLILFHSKLPGNDKDSYSSMLQTSSRYLGFTPVRYPGRASMVASSSTRLSSAGTPSSTSTFGQRMILILCNMKRQLILLSLGQSYTSRYTTVGKFSTDAMPG